MPFEEYVTHHYGKEVRATALAADMTKLVNPLP